MSDENRNENQRRDVIALELVIREINEPFCDIAGQPQVQLNQIQDVPQVWPLHSRRFRSWIAEFVWETATIVLFDQELNRILTVLEGRAWKHQRVDAEVCEAIENDPLFEAILIWINERRSFDGRSTKLLIELKKTARKSGIDTRSQAWPKAPAQLSRRISQLETLLERAGIGIEVGRRPGGERFIRLTTSDACDGTAEVPSHIPTVDKLHHPNTLPPHDGCDGQANDIFNRVQQRTERTSP